MTLHRTIELSRKIIMYISIGVGTAIALYLLVQLGVIIKNVIAPPPVQQPTVAYGKIPSLTFPANSTEKKLTYTLNTITGTLPEFPGRLAVFKTETPQPNFLNLSKAKEKAGQLRFVDEDGALLPERKIDSATYQWQETTGIKRKLTFDIVSFNFNLESNFLTQPAQRAFPMSEADALTKVTNFLSRTELTPEDLDLEKTTNPDEERNITTKPHFFTITNGQLIPVDTINDTKIIRIDLYQKDVSYKLNTGIPTATGGIRKDDITVPILYPHPPYSTMTFWVGSNESDTDVIAANFFHQKPLIDESDKQATYPIKTAEQAFEELQEGKGYIASYFGTDTTISITNVFLAYYVSDQQEKYLMPIIVFQGNNGFFAYISAINEDWIESQEQ